MNASSTPSWRGSARPLLSRLRPDHGPARLRPVSLSLFPECVCGRVPVDRWSIPIALSVFGMRLTPTGSEHNSKLPEKTSIHKVRGAESGAPGASTAINGPSEESLDLDAILQAWPQLASEHRNSLAKMAADWIRPIPGSSADPTPPT